MSGFSVVVVFHSSWFLEENVTMEVSSLLLMKMKVFLSSRGQNVAFNHHRQDENDYHHSQQGQSNNQGPYPQGLVAEVIGHGVSKGNTDEQTIRIFLYLDNQKKLLGR